MPPDEIHPRILKSFSSYIAGPLRGVFNQTIEDKKKKYSLPPRCVVGMPRPDERIFTLADLEPRGKLMQTTQ